MKLALSLALVIGCGAETYIAPDLPEDAARPSPGDAARPSPQDATPVVVDTPCTTSLRAVQDQLLPDEVAFEAGAWQAGARRGEVPHRLAVHVDELAGDGLTDEELLALGANYLCRREVDYEGYLGDRRVVRPVDHSRFGWQEAALEANRRSQAAGLEACYVFRPAADEPSQREIETRGPSCLGYRLPSTTEWIWLAASDLSAQREVSWACLAGVGDCPTAPRRLKNLLGNLKEFLDLEPATVVRTWARSDPQASHELIFEPPILALGRTAQDRDLPVEPLIPADYRFPGACVGVRLVRTLPPDPSCSIERTIRLDPVPYGVPTPARCPEAPPGWTLVPPGRYPIEGAERPYLERERHLVSLDEGLLVSNTEVAGEAWKRMRLPPELYPRDYPRVPIQHQGHALSDQHPVERVSLLLALIFANWMSEQAGLEACYRYDTCQVEWTDWFLFTECNEFSFTGVDCVGFRLPTEDEWQVVARSLMSRHPGRDPREGAWFLPGCFEAEREGRGPCTPRPVGHPSALLHDLVGNVGELAWPVVRETRVPWAHVDARVPRPYLHSMGHDYRMMGPGDPSTLLSGSYGFIDWHGPVDAMGLRLVRTARCEAP